MSTPPTPDPRLADQTTEADDDQPDLDRENPGPGLTRVPPEEVEERIPEPNE
jgi:hypothetical protein